MKITARFSQAPSKIAILNIDGKLGGSNYHQLIEMASQQFASGYRKLLLDLSLLSFISSAGLVGIHQVALMFRGEITDGGQDGWAALHDLQGSRLPDCQPQVKLLSPNAEVRTILEVTGFTNLFQIFTDLETALASFFPPVPAGPPSESSLTTALLVTSL